MNDNLTYILYVITTLFTIINPLAILPLFTASTEGLSKQLVFLLAWRSSLACFIALAFFGTTGDILFSFFNISLNGLRIVGGLIMFVVGYDMLQGKLARTKLLSSSEKQRVDEEVKVLAITPLGIPLLCGPGSITVITVLQQDAQGYSKMALLYLGTLIVCVLSGVFLFSSQKIVAFMGPSGNKVLLRIMGLIMMMIAIEFFFTGLTPYVYKMIHG